MIHKIPNYRIPKGCEECDNRILNQIISLKLMNIKTVFEPKEFNYNDWYALFKQQNSKYNIIYYNYNKFSKDYDKLLTSEESNNMIKLKKINYIKGIFI